MPFSNIETTIQSIEPSISIERIRDVCWITLAVVGYMLVFRIWFDLDARAYRRGLLRAKKRKSMMQELDGEMMLWSDLEKEAQWVVDEVMAKLPPKILAEAEKVPVLFEERSRRKTNDGRGFMGIYVGFSEGLVSESKGPIILYLRTIEECCTASGNNFRDEVRTTYLHELGHHFGWSEKEVEERGL